MATLAYQEESDFEADCAMSDDSFAFDEESDFEMEPVAVKAKKSKSNTKENAPKKTAKKGGSKKKVAFDDSSDEEEGRAVLGEKSLNKDTNKTSKSTGKKTVEEIYQKKTQLEHILLRPDTYSKHFVNHVFSIHRS
jgi:DNA topoisomerase-2